MKKKYLLLILLLLTLVLAFSCAKNNPVSANNTTDNNIESGIENNEENNNNVESNDGYEDVLLYPELIYGEYKAESYELYTEGNIYDQKKGSFTIVNEPVILGIWKPDEEIAKVMITYSFNGHTICWCLILNTRFENGFQIVEGTGTAAGNQTELGFYFLTLKFDSNYNLVEATVYGYNSNQTHVSHNLKKTPITYN